MNQINVIPGSDVIATELPEQETVLLHLQRGDYYTLNETGTLLWQGLQQQQSITALSQTLAARYALNPEEAMRHVMQLVDELAAEGLVTPR